MKKICIGRALGKRFGPAGGGGRGRVGAWLGAACLGLVLGCVGVPVEPEPVLVPTEELSLEGALEVALHNNPDLRIGRQRVLQAGELVDQAASAYWPEVQVGGRFTRTNRPAYVFSGLLDQGNFEQGIDFNDPGSLSNVRPQVGAGLTLYDGGRRKARGLQVDAELGAQLAGQEVLQSLISFQVARAWFGVHSLEAALGADQEAAKITQELLELAERELEAGARLPRDVERLRVAKAQADQKLRDRLAALHKARTALGLLLGLSREQMPALTEFKDFDIAPLDSLETSLAHARFGRAELRRAQHEIEAGVAAVDLAEAGYFPELTLFGEFGADDPKGRLQHSNWLFGAGLVQSLTEVLRTPSRVRQAASELIIAHEKGRKVLLEVDSEVEAAWLDAAQIDGALGTARAEWERAQQEWIRVGAEEQVGAARRAAVLQANLSRAQARASLEVAELQDAMGRIALDHAEGNFPSAENGSEETSRTNLNDSGLRPSRDQNRR